MALSRRLAAVLGLVDECEILADIGTDHGLLPIEACNLNLCTRAIACDIGRKPLDVARANIAAAGLSHRIETRLGDGLRPLHIGEADCVVISGMGGMRIWSILHDELEKVKTANRLILGPQHNIPELRKNLHGMGCEIFAEKLVYEDSHFYTILAARYAENVEPWTDEEYFLGKHLGDSADYVGYLQYHRELIFSYVGSVSHPNSRQLAEMRLGWIEAQLVSLSSCKREKVHCDL